MCLTLHHCGRLAEEKAAGKFLVDFGITSAGRSPESSFEATVRVLTGAIR